MIKQQTKARYKSYKFNSLEIVATQSARDERELRERKQCSKSRRRGIGFVASLNKENK